jgi:hypothetical protein
MKLLVADIFVNHATYYFSPALNVTLFGTQQVTLISIPTSYLSRSTTALNTLGI